MKERAWLTRCDNKTDLTSGFGAHTLSHRADRLPRPSFFATPCKVFTGLAPPSLAPALSPLPPFPFLPGLAHLLLALSPSPLAAGGRERYTSRAERPLRPKSCRLLISLSCSESWSGQDEKMEHNIHYITATIQVWCNFWDRLNNSFTHLVLSRQCPRHSWPGTVLQQLTGVCVDEVEGIFQHVCWDLLQND